MHNSSCWEWNLMCKTALDEKKRTTLTLVIRNSHCSVLDSSTKQIVLDLFPSVKALCRIGCLCLDGLSHQDMSHPCPQALWKFRCPSVLRNAPWCINSLEDSVGMVIEEITSLHYLWRSSGLTVHYARWKQHVSGYQRPWQLQRATSFSNITALRGEKMSPFWALLDHWFDSEPAKKVCKSKGISEWFVSYFVNRVQIIKAKFPSVSNHFTYNLIPLQ